MKKVFIVTEGIYSDYRIRAVFSTRQKAKEFIRYQPDGIIEVWAFDTPLDELLQYKIRMTQKGKVTYDSLNTRENGERRFVFYREEDPELLNYVSTLDRERAIKVTNELRQRAIALNIWGDTKKLQELG